MAFAGGGDQLLVWDDNANVLRVFDTQSWAQVSTISMPWAPYSSSNGRNWGELSAGDNGSFLYVGGAMTSIDLAAKGLTELTATAPSAGLIEAGVNPDGSATAGVSTSTVDLTPSGGTAALTYATAGWASLGSGLYSQTGTYGSAVLDTVHNTLTYTLNNNAAATLALGVGVIATDSFTVEVGDGTSNASDLVSFSVTGTDIDPTVIGHTQAADNTVPSIASSAALLAGSASVKGELLHVVSVSNATHGSVTLDAQGDAVFTPDAGYLGPASYDYTVSDGKGGSATASVQVAVFAPASLTASAPSAALVEAGVTQAGQATPGVATSTVDLTPSGGDAPTYVLNGWSPLGSGLYSQTGTYGSVVLDTVHNTLTYSLNNSAPAVLGLGVGVTAADTFRVAISDGLTTASVPVSFAVTGTDIDPTVIGHAFSTGEGTPLVESGAALLSGSADLKGEMLHVSGVGAATHGSVVLDGQGNAVFTPDAGYVGPASYAYTVSDGLGGTATATVQVDVLSPAKGINIVWDPSVANAPAGFKAAVQAAVDFFESKISTPINLNIEFGYGQINGQALSGGDTVGESLANGVDLTYAQVLAALTASATSADDAAAIASLPTTDPTNGGQFFVSSAEAKALGVYQGAPSRLDGYVALSASQPFTFDPNNRAVPGLYDAVGVLEHEISEVLGRMAGLGQDLTGSTPEYSPLDLFRYSAPGVRDLNSDGAYFSLDGRTMLSAFNDGTLNGGDAGDWASSVAGDAFDAFISPGQEASVSATDLRVMDVLGYTLTVSTDDFDGAPASEVAFRQVSTGNWGYMTANASGGETWHPVGQSSPDYGVIGTGDFSGDGRADIAFRSTADGDWGYMSVNASGGETWHGVGPTSLAYAAIGVGDFNGDGSVDIAFRNTTTGDWGFMTPNASGGETWHGVGSTSTAYAAVGVGDFDGQGRDEIAFRNSITGDFGYMSVSATGTEVWHPIGPTSPDYAAVGVGDFNGDGLMDVAFRQVSTGNWGFMTINPGGGETWHGVGQTSTDYAVIGAADYNGDGRTDLAFRQASTGNWGFMSVSAAGAEVWRPVGATSTDYTAL